jgi:porphobilinogen synthase
MMDGQVLYLRRLLDNHGFKHVKILSYSAKHNSCLYSPFRNSNYQNPNFIDKASYQCSFNNKSESIREILLDVKEGADWVMIKPSLWYMDIIRHVRKLINVPIVVQNVSGEYALLRSLMDSVFLKGLSVHTDIPATKTTNTRRKINGFSKEGGGFRSAQRCLNQSLTYIGDSDNWRNPGDLSDNNIYDIDSIGKFILSLKRAGADKIITYFLLDLIKGKDDKLIQ